MVFPGDVPDWGGTTQQGLYTKPTSLTTALSGSQIVTLIPGIAGQNIYLLSGTMSSRKTLNPVFAALNQTVPALGTVQVIPNVAGNNTYLYSGNISVQTGGAQVQFELEDGNGNFIQYLVCNSGSSLSWDFAGKQLSTGFGLVLVNLVSAVTPNIWLDQAYIQIATADSPLSDRVALQDSSGNTLFQFQPNAQAPISWEFGFAKLASGLGLQLKNLSTNPTAQLSINQLYLQG